MRANNVVSLAGNLTADPEPPRQVGADGLVTRARLAVNGRKRADGTEDVLYIDLDVWGKGGEVLAQYGKKGKSIQVVGELKLDVWDDKNNPGQKRSKHFLRVDDFRFVGPPAGDEGGEEPAAAPAKAPAKPAGRGGKKPTPAPSNDGFGDDSDPPF